MNKPLQADSLYIIDGAMATELESRGADLDDPLWSARVLLEAPHLIEAVHYDYFLAGADIAISASYQASFPGLAARGLDRRAAQRLIESSVDLARRARQRYLDSPDGGRAGPAPLVAASLGPFGAHRHDGSEYHGNYGVSAAALLEFHRPQLEALASSGADLLAFETIPSLAEGEAIVRLLEEFPELPAWLSFSCRSATEVSHGEAFTRCAALANERGNLLATGVNCTAPEFVDELIAAAAGVTDKALLAYPNSGEQWRAESNCWSGSTQESIAERAVTWYAAGARLIGGCCRTTPRDIAAIARALRA